MADFCRQCSLDEFGKDFGDLAQITTPEEEAQGLYAVVLCEGCGPIQVTAKGMCLGNCSSESHLDKDPDTE